MIERIRLHVCGLIGSVSARRRRRAERRRASEGAVLKGCMRNVIVVHPRSDIFQEAVFILRDDYLRAPGISREELLRQARNAAEDYTLTAAPQSSRRARKLLPFALLLAAAVLCTLHFAGLL